MTLSGVARFFAEALTLGIAAIILLRARGKGFRGLLVSSTTAARFTPERLLLLSVSLLLAGWYLFRILASPGGDLPPLSNACLWAFAASCLVYAVVKAARTFGWIGT